MITNIEAAEKKNKELNIKLDIIQEMLQTSFITDKEQMDRFFDFRIEVMEIAQNEVSKAKKLHELQNYL